MQLLFEVSVHGFFHGRRTNPNALPAETRGNKSKDQSTVSPERHDPAGAGPPLGHCCPEHCAVPKFVGQRLLEKRRNLRIDTPSHPKLGSVNAYSSMFAGVIDLQDPADRESISCHVCISQQAQREAISDFPPSSCPQWLAA